MSGTLENGHGSKWNKVAHRLFAFITQNWRGKPLVSHAVIVQLIGATATETGLQVCCEIDRNLYPKGIQVSEQEMQALNLTRAEFHGEWNYTIAPKQQPPRSGYLSADPYGTYPAGATFGPDRGIMGVAGSRPRLPDVHTRASVHVRAHQQMPWGLVASSLKSSPVSKARRIPVMTQTPVTLPHPVAPDHNDALVLAIELSNKSWVLAAQVPGLTRVKAKQTIEPTAEALLAALQGYRARAKVAGRHIQRVIATYEAGWSGFWLARLLATHGVETHVVQPSSVLVDRRARRAKSDGIDAELLLRTLLAWLRGEPRVCSMVPIPAEGDEDARRSVRERTELVAERVALVNGIGAVLATMGCGDYDPLLRNRRQRLGELRTALGSSLPVHAHAKINRMLDRLDLVRTQIAELEQDRDAVLEEEVPDKAGEMIQQLAKLRGIGAQSATVLVREAFVRDFPNGKALGSYAGLCATPYSSGSTDREQGIGKAGNRRLRTVMIELAWLWQRYQPGSAEVTWFRARVSGTGARMRKIMVVALARKLLIALWRFATQGVIPEGAVMKPAS